MVGLCAGQYAGAIVAVMCLGFFSMALKTLNVILSMAWKHTKAPAGAHQQTVSVPLTAANALSNANGTLTNGTHNGAVNGRPAGPLAEGTMAVHSTGPAKACCQHAQHAAGHVALPVAEGTLAHQAPHGTVAGAPDTPDPSPVGLVMAGPQHLLASVMLPSGQQLWKSGVLAVITGE